MKRRFYPIVCKIILCLLSIVLLLYKVIKQLVLPNRTQKGNIISSVLLFFTSFFDLIIKYTSEVSFKRISRLKYYTQFRWAARKAIFIITCFLFLLSSLEWSYNQQQRIKKNGIADSIELQLHKFCQKENCQTSYHSLPPKRLQVKEEYQQVARPLFYTKKIPFSSIKVYIRNCQYLI